MRTRPARGAAGLLLVMALALVAPSGAAHGQALFGERWDLTGEQAEPLKVVPHRPVYILPLSYDEEAPGHMLLPGQGLAERDREELIYQFSVKALLIPDLLGGSGDLWAGYTQRGWWQAYNAGESQPFRETNYEPELIYTYQPHSAVFGVEPRMLTLRLSHLSDGRGPVRSRSFNRLGAGLWFDDGKQTFRYQAWYPLPSGGSVDGDRLADYFGRVQMDWHRPVGRSQLHLMLRNNLRLDENRTSLALGFSFPTASPHLRGFVEYRHGYNGGLVDYDRVTNRLSVGAMFVGWY